MSIEVLILIGFGILILVLFVLVITKDSQISAKFSKFELVLEGLIKENYQLKKDLGQNPQGERTQPLELNFKEIYDKIQTRVTSDINSKVIPMLESIKNIEKIIEDFQNEQQNRLYELDERTKSFSKITPPSFDTEENRIIELYNTGKSIETIARDLQLSVGKVTMILKFHKAI